MNQERKRMFYIDATALQNYLDIEVMTNTEFDFKRVDRLYGVDNHELNYDWIEKLGLGVVRTSYFNDYFIYNATYDNLINESTRIGLYYQLTHPEYDDKELDRWIFGDKDGINYLLELVGEHGLLVVSKLKEIYRQKKGNVIKFPIQKK
ncbi:hypothetical protein J7E18_03235 [Oceanobacillus sp. ISL-73]|nr:hypothetical protein [Oceanobacillus sp. ISL-74]MBT2650882.1 hypothetical protein [Oceanobacillus sp. ISL-73]